MSVIPFKKKAISETINNPLHDYLDFILIEQKRQYEEMGRITEEYRSRLAYLERQEVELGKVRDDVIKSLRLLPPELQKRVK